MTLALTGGSIVPATRTDIVLRCDEQLRHCFGSEISRHGEVPYLVAPQISEFSWPISLVPISGDQDPAVLAYFGQKCFVSGSDVRGYILLVDAISNASSVQLVLNFRTIPVFVKVEGKVRQPFP